MKEEQIRHSMISVRDKYIEIIRSELLGPGSEFDIPDKEHELISSSPLSRYTIGILFPKENLIEQDNDETLSLGDGEEAFIAELPEATIVSDVNENKNKNMLEPDETENDNLDEEIGMASQFKPSSMGLTFLVKGQTDKIYCDVEFATYRRAKMEDCVVPYEIENNETYSVVPELAHILIYDNQKNVFRLKTGINRKELQHIFEKDTIPENEYKKLRNVAYRMVDYLSVGYVRVPHMFENIEIDFTDKDYCEKEITDELEKMKVQIVAKKTRVSDSIWSITVMLVNDLDASPASATDCLFQPMISIKTNNNQFSFVENGNYSDNGQLDEEMQSLELLYRHKKVYGTGHGVSVDWKINGSGMGHIFTDFFPEKEIPAMSFSIPSNDIIRDDELSMKYLSDLSKATKQERINSLKKLVDLYSHWIEKLREKTTKLEDRYLPAAIRNISECERAASRMYEGIKTLDQNEYAYNAFLLANRAMFMQRIHIRKQMEMAKTEADRYPEDKEISDWLKELDYRDLPADAGRWRPFQIAFMLMDINSIVIENSQERSLVDLIWFPTGGGKTEAYLGLTAFTIFYRRMKNLDTADGTAVMMRYTLRLLAAQQFNRASTLICACEYIRQDSEKKKHRYPAYSLGKKPITIGLWIGGAHIPNKNVGSGKNTAQYHIDELQNVSKYSLRNAKDRHNKFQVLKCPWCGTKMVKDVKNNKMIGEWGYAMNGKHFFMFCPHEDCNFTNRLPIQVIDEELYENPPTLLFGTVDKFAMMPWDARIGAFFACNSKNRSPELIIQDELHLISGALGTMVGLYETAVDGLASMKGVKPKIIASTATIRRAKEQCSVLYNRDVVQFPAPGLDAEDSFFAREDIIDYEADKYGRKYVGIMPSGRTKAMTEIRSIAALLQKIFTMNIPDEVKDKLWTLTVYFNSLKDLGKTSTLVDDDIKDFIIRIANRMFTGRRLVVNADELTSRVSTTELNETLDKLERIEYSKDNIDNKEYASNVLLATNMISVGIDVARLNVMLMVGQPKLTSEYIQASSRVGRSYPGVVFVQYDATKSRDRSHYERFKSYHDSFYRFVEPTGATPFSSPARERALHAVFTAIIRQQTSLLEDNSASSFDKKIYDTELQRVCEYIINRVNEINDRSNNGVCNDITDIQEELENFIDFWQKSVDISKKDGEKQLCFGKRYMTIAPQEGEHRLLKQYNSSGKDEARETLTSMRNVDTSVAGSVIIWEE